jgi:hypothetical protein
MRGLPSRTGARELAQERRRLWLYSGGEDVLLETPWWGRLRHVKRQAIPARIDSLGRRIGPCRPGKLEVSGSNPFPATFRQGDW